MNNLHEPEDRTRYYAQGLWRDETFYDLLGRQADAQPEAGARRGSRRRLNWRNLHAWVNGIAADLTDRGLGAGDRASIWLGNRAEVLATFLACNRQSIACNPSLHRTHTGEEVVALLERLGARLLLTESGHGEGDAFIAGSLRPDGLDTVLTPETLAGPGAPPETPRADPDATC
jgi:acyl-CoA synthetase